METNERVHLIVDKIPVDPEQYRGTVPISNSSLVFGPSVFLNFHRMGKN